MAQPHSAVTWITGVSTPWLYEFRSKISQSRPYTDRLPYYRFVQTVRQENDANGWNAWTNISLGEEVNLDSQTLKLRDKLREKCGSQAMLLVNYKERKQSFQMITARATQMATAYKQLRNLDIHGVMRTLGVSHDKKTLEKTTWLARKKRFGDAWLEFHFGWRPLVMDIYSCIDILQQPCPSHTVKVRNRDKYTYHSEDRWTDIVIYNGQPKQYPFGSIGETEYEVMMQYIADLQVDNPNVYMANQLGVVNPAQVLWEVIPYSFLVDWFIPVGSFLNQYTDFSGMSLGQPMTTTTITRRRVKRAVRGEVWEDYTYTRNESFAKAMHRERGISNANFPMPSIPLGLSPTRAATAVSLLLQQLRR